ncbi:hypothetical protein [Mesorhizobium sp. M8A.F.Ca.ET.213.01.1.1]|uniref:DUF768 domain-containing protein n=1 Tax=Mesorhizobium sp. M8A.F.Ca.ET.213.01.1.1 TaxID=2563970 RepID=UPI002688A29B
MDREHAPKTAKPSVIAVDELTDQRIADAKAIGIKRVELDEEVDSLFRTILEAIVYVDPGMPDWRRQLAG